jgi:hypothetical protein
MRSCGTWQVVPAGFLLLLCLATLAWGVEDHQALLTAANFTHEDSDDFPYTISLPGMSYVIDLSNNAGLPIDIKADTLLIGGVAINGADAEYGPRTSSLHIAQPSFRVHEGKTIPEHSFRADGALECVRCVVVTTANSEGKCEPYPR